MPICSFGPHFEWIKLGVLFFVKAIESCFNSSGGFEHSEEPRFSQGRVRDFRLVKRSESGCFRTRLSSSASRIPCFNDTSLKREFKLCWRGRGGLGIGLDSSSADDIKPSSRLWMQVGVLFLAKTMEFCSINCGGFAHSFSIMGDNESLSLPLLLLLVKSKESCLDSCACASVMLCLNSWCSLLCDKVFG